MIKELIANQFRKPRGFLGIIAANLMKKPNQEPYDRIIEMLEIENSDQILEIGSGPGRGIKQITEKNKTCTVDAIDFSKLMIKKAASNNKTAIQENRVTLMFGNVLDYDFSGRKYSKIFAINVIYFWKELQPVFRKLIKILKPGGRLLLYMSGPELLASIPFAVDEVFNKYSLDHVTMELKASGYDTVNSRTILKNGLATYYICAQKE